jgi:hypothetical protein
MNSQQANREAVSCSSPAPLGSLDGADHSNAMEVSLIKHHQRHGVAVKIDGMTLAGDPAVETWFYSAETG